MFQQSDANTALDLTRTFAATRDRVYRAWTEPEALVVWWWPWSPTITIDPRFGGLYRFAADVPRVGPLAVSGEFLLVAPPERLRYTFTFDGEDRTTIVDAAFTERGPESDVVLRHTGFADAEDRDRNRDGWISCLDRLQALLARPRVAPDGRPRR